MINHYLKLIFKDIGIFRFLLAIVVGFCAIIFFAIQAILRDGWIEL